MGNLAEETGFYVEKPNTLEAKTLLETETLSFETKIQKKPRFILAVRGTPIAILSVKEKGF